MLSVDTPVGRLCIREEGGAIRALDWAACEREEPTPLLVEAKRQLKDYFAGRRTGFDLPLAPDGTEFRRSVYRAMQAIPYGETRTYGDLARDLQSAARAVGGACGANPIAIIIPCHRVVGASGKLTGYSGAGGTDTKAWLLAFEHQRQLEAA
jgi:methylated-DNA-[protein]-cysteine S-methyltransferase